MHKTMSEFIIIQMKTQNQMMLIKHYLSKIASFFITNFKDRFLFFNYVDAYV